MFIRAKLQFIIGEKMKKRIKDYFPTFSLVFFLIFIITMLIWRCAILNSAFADWIVSNIGLPIRIFFSSVTSFTPYSITEILFSVLVLTILANVIFTLRSGLMYNEIFRRLVAIVSVVAFAVALYAYTLGIGYHTTSLSQRLSMESCDLSELAARYTA